MAKGTRSFPERREANRQDDSLKLPLDGGAVLEAFQWTQSRSRQCLAFSSQPSNSPRNWGWIGGGAW